MLNFFRVRKQLSEVTALLDAMGDRLHDHQVQIEVMGEALTRKDDDNLAFVHRLHETMGGDQKLMCEGDALARLRVLRGQSDKYLDMVAAMRGDYDAEGALLRRLACALGCAQFDLDTIVKRAAQLASELPKNVKLTRELEEKRQKVEDLEDELDEIVEASY